MLQIIRFLLCGSLCLPLFATELDGHEKHSSDERHSGNRAKVEDRNGIESTSSHWAAAELSAEGLSSSIGGLHSNTRTLSARHRDVLGDGGNRDAGPFHDVVSTIAPKAARSMVQIAARNADTERSIAKAQKGSNSLQASIQDLNEMLQMDPSAPGKSIQSKKLQQSTDAFNNLQQQIQDISSNSTITMQQIEQAQEQLQSEIHSFKVSHSKPSGLEDKLEKHGISTTSAVSSYEREISFTRDSYVNMQSQLNKVSTHLEALKEQLGYVDYHLN